MPFSNESISVGGISFCSKVAIWLSFKQGTKENMENRNK